MEKAGLLAHEKEGLTHRYRPTVSRREATGSLLSDFLARFFHGSAEQLILGLVDAEQLAPGDLGAIEAKLGKAEGETATGSIEPAAKPKRRRREP